MKHNGGRSGQARAKTSAEAGGLSQQSATRLSLPQAPGLFYRDLYVGGVDKAADRKAIDYAERRVDVVASTEALDSHGEIVEQSWLLDRYLANPVVLWNHNSLFQSDKKPIGRAENVRVDNAGTPQAALKMSIIFASEAANPEAERILRLFDEGIQRAVSVGFRPTELRSERRDDRDITILAENILYELSATPIGANPDALSERRAAQQQWIDARLSDCKDNPSASERGGNSDKETAMDLKELQAALNKANEELGSARAERDKAVAHAKALDTQNATLVEERDAAMKELGEFTADAVKAKVEALVGVKFTRDEVDDQIKLALSNPDLYDRLTAQRSEMTLLTSDPVGAGRDPAPEPVSGDANGEGFATIVNAAVSG